MRALVIGLVLASGCGTDDSGPTAVVVEYQPTALADARPDGWRPGEGVVLVAEPGTPAFPLALTFRISLASTASADRLPLRGVVLRNYSATTQLAATAQPMCLADLPDTGAYYCAAGFDVAGAGGSVMSALVNGIDATGTGCFYFAVVDASVDTVELRSDLDAQRDACLAQD